MVTSNHQNEGLQIALLRLMAARNGHFKLESGHHGDLWLDLDRLFLHPREVQSFAIALAHRLASYQVAAVCGPLVGGALLAQTVAAELDAEFYYAERFVLRQHDGLYPVEYRLPAGLRARVHGKPIAIVDDVINAGSAVRGTLAELRACGARPIVVGALLVLGAAAPEYFAVQGLPVERLAALPSCLWVPNECPLCAAHVPIEDNLSPSEQQTSMDS
jgi:orotate phosphoribosyltransferase